MISRSRMGFTSPSTWTTSSSSKAPASKLIRSNRSLRETRGFEWQKEKKCEIRWCQRSLISDVLFFTVYFFSCEYNSVAVGNRANNYVGKLRALRLFDVNASSKKNKVNEKKRVGYVNFENLHDFARKKATLTAKVEDGVAGFDVREESVSQALTLGGTLHQTSDVDYVEESWNFAENNIDLFNWRIFWKYEKIEFKTEMF